MIEAAQISDIHIGGEYNGAFDCMGNLKKVIKELCKLPVLDYLFITGDLCDNHDEDEYIDLSLELHRLKLRFPEIKMFAVGGNHDDFFKMSIFLHDVEVVEGIYQSNAFINVTDPKVGLTQYQKDYIITHSPKNVFMHYPVGNCPHAFMHTPEHDINDPEGIAKFFADNGVNRVFCGHYHNAYYSQSQYGFVDDVRLERKYLSPAINICPAVQTQLNPESTTCDPNDKRPGYNLITFSDNWDVAQIKTNYIDI